MNDKHTLRIGSLFAGIGGLELGLERAGLGRVVWQVEIDPKRCAVLAKHWPEAQRFSDVQKVSATRCTTTSENALDQVEVICGGFPCQDVSGASRGRGGGITGKKSGLWKEYARIVEEIEPAIVVVENVALGAPRWLPTVRRDLHVLGYRTRALRVDASDVGAPHSRPRVFVVGYANAGSQPTLPVDGEVAGLQTPARLGGGWRIPVPRSLRMAHGVPGELDRVHALGDAVIPDCAELIGRVIVASLKPTPLLTKASIL